MTALEQKFITLYKQKHPEADESTIHELMKANLIDFRTMKIAITRFYVADCVKRGCGKREAMKLVADDLATSYEYVKSACYNKVDVNI